MSAEAPWIALAVDWDESDMWMSLPQYGIADESTHGERLAWVCLLCYLGAVGRRQKRFDPSRFSMAYKLDAVDVENMLNRAELFGAIRYNGGRVVVADWSEWGRGNDQRQSRAKIPSHLRLEIFSRDGGRCRYCAMPATSLDHVIPHSRGGPDSALNLVACCYDCNTRKSARTPEEAGMVLIEITDGN